MKKVAHQSTTRHTLFEASIALRGIQAAVQLIGAIFIYATTTSTIQNVILHATNDELTEAPHDLLIRLLIYGASHISEANKDFAALFFFACAAVNLVLVAGLLTRKRSMFPIAIYLIAAFVMYQMYLFTQTLSLWLIVLTIYEGAMIWLIYLEYREHMLSEGEGQ